MTTATSRAATGATGPPDHGRGGREPSPLAARSADFALGASLILLAVAAGALLSFRWIPEPDLWWHLAQGRADAAGRLVRTNLFSGAYPDFPQPYTSWLFELGAFCLWSIGGDAGVQFGQLIVVVLTLALIYFACRRRGTLAATLALEAFGLFVIEPRATPRPHLVSLALMAACALVVERARGSRSAAPLGWAILIIALWSNIHAECLFGAAFIAMFAAGEFLRPQALLARQCRIALAIAAACALATLANPYGTGLFTYLWENSNVPEFLKIAEFRPAYLPVYAPFFVYLTCGAGLILWEPRKLAWWEALVFAAFAILALQHVRFVGLFFCATAAMIAPRLAAAIPERAHPTVTAAIGLWAGLLLAPVPLAQRIAQFGIGADFLAPPADFSTGAIAFIRQAGLSGKIFNSNNLGGYLIWELYPQVRVFSDGRLQAYPQSHFEAIEDAYRSQPAWDALLSDIDWAVLATAHGGALSGGGRFPPEQWAVVYWDDAVEIVVRRSGKFGTLADADEYHLFLPARAALPDWQLNDADRAAAIAEARRNEAESPQSFRAPAFLCRLGDPRACERALALAAHRPELRADAIRLRQLHEAAGTEQ
jgi:hypothetical protein